MYVVVGAADGGDKHGVISSDAGEIGPEIWADFH
jgi:hypothetical protein